MCQAGWHILAEPSPVGASGATCQTQGGVWRVLWRALYGVPLTLPGQFVAAQEPHLEQLVKQLCDVQGPLMRAVASPPPTEAPATFQHAKHIYVGAGNTSLPLAPQYHGPYRVAPRPSMCRLARRRSQSPLIASSHTSVPHRCSQQSCPGGDVCPLYATTAPMPPWSLGGGHVEAPPYSKCTKCDCAKSANS